MAQRFEGSDYDHRRDAPRLSTQHAKVRDTALRWPGGWFTMERLAAAVGEPPASVERQVRYLRAPRFGGYHVEKRHVAGGTFEYRVSWAFEPDGQMLLPGSRTGGR